MSSIGRSTLVLAATMFYTGEVAASAQPPAASGFAEVARGRLYYEAAGSGEAVVLIHGNVGDRRHWDRQFSALAKDFRVVRYDVRGFGRSTPPTVGVSYSDCDDVAALLDQLGVKRAHVVGWSMGAAIAVDFALAYPNRMLSVVPVGPWVSGYSSPAAQALFTELSSVSNAFKQGGTAAAVQAWMDAPFFAATIRTPAAGAEFRRIALDHSFWGFANPSQARALVPPAAARLADITVPMLIVTAEHDIPVCREMAELFLKSVPGAREVVLRGTGHLMHFERPGEFNDRLRNFLQSATKR